VCPENPGSQTLLEESSQERVTWLLATQKIYLFLKLLYSSHTTADGEEEPRLQGTPGGLKFNSL